MISIKRYSLLLAAVFFALFAFASTAQAETLYGSLYQVGNLNATDGTNTESVLMYYPGENGFIAITTNETGSEWWISGKLGMNWEMSEDNPLEEYGCTIVGRHSVVIADDTVYFGANCEDGASVFELTGQESAERVHTVSDVPEGLEAGGYPTATLIGSDVYMFYNGGYSHYDAEEDIWSDVTDAEGQTGSVPLEVSSEQDGVVYLPLVNGEVHSFDGEAYTLIGEDYLEDLGTSANSNLPSAEVFNDTVYVGNQDFDNGATLFKYDSEGEEWSEAADLEDEDIIINKAKVADDIDDSSYLVFFTANNTDGTNVYSIDEDDTVTQLIDSGLGGTDPEHNSEVISVVNRTVEYGRFTEDIQIFSTKNHEDETKIFVLSLGTDLAFSGKKSRVYNKVTAENATPATKSLMKKAPKTVFLEEGKSFRYKLKKKEVQKGAVYTLWVNGEKVDRVKLKKRKKVVLKYPEASEMQAGEKFNVKIGVRRTYGRKTNRKLARNTIKGKRIKVVIAEAQD